MQILNDKKEHKETTSTIGPVPTATGVSKEIVQNSSQEIDLEDLDISKNVLICNVKRDNTRRFLNGTAKIYYTGKKFPSTIALNKLYYFMPSIIRKQRIRVVL